MARRMPQHWWRARERGAGAAAAVAAVLTIADSSFRLAESFGMRRASVELLRRVRSAGALVRRRKPSARPLPSPVSAVAASTSSARSMSSPLSSWCGRGSSSTCSRCSCRPRGRGKGLKVCPRRSCHASQRPAGRAATLPLPLARACRGPGRAYNVAWLGPGPQQGRVESPQLQVLLISCLLEHLGHLLPVAASSRAAGI